MKKFLFSILLTTLYICSNAQPNAPLTNDGLPQGKQNQIQSTKIAFFTAELELTPKEAEEFWPIYNNFWRERELSFKRIQGNLNRITKALDGDKKVSEAELKNILDKYIADFSTEGEIFKNYYLQFQKILPVEKVAKIYVAEEKFRMRMIHMLRRGSSNQGQEQNQGQRQKRVPGQN